MPRPAPRDIVELSSIHAAASPRPNPSSAPAPRPWISVSWACCSTYSRIYRNRDGTAYVGRCPRCQREVRAAIGEGGTHNRFFTAS